MRVLGCPRFKRESNRIESNRLNGVKSNHVWISFFNLNPSTITTTTNCRPKEQVDNIRYTVCCIAHGGVDVCLVCGACSMRWDFLFHSIPILLHFASPSPLASDSLFTDAKLDANHINTPPQRNRILIQLLLLIVSSLDPRLRPFLPFPFSPFPGPVSVVSSIQFNFTILLQTDITIIRSNANRITII